MRLLIPILLLPLVACSPAGELPEPTEGNAVVEGFAEIQPLLEQWCGGCHSGRAEGGTDFVSEWSDNLEPAIIYPACVERQLTVGECSVLRIRDYSMPTDGWLVAPSHVDRLEAWVSAGMPH